MADEHPNDPLHGVTLEKMLSRLVNKYGWNGLAKRIRINCLKTDPTISSVLNFLRKTPWARKKVEELYLGSMELTRLAHSLIDVGGASPARTGRNVPLAERSICR